jgi:uncharacterized membrane protein YqjE
LSGPDIAEAANQLSRSIARLASTTAGYVGTRLDQMDSAIRAERRRWLWILVGTGALLLCLGVAAVFAGIAIVMAFGESSRVLASALVATGFFVLAAVAGAVLWQCRRRSVSVADRIAGILALFLEGRNITR